MLVIFLFFALTTRMAANQVLYNDNEQNILLLTVYYESNAIDSRWFILQQLVPAVRALQHHVALRLIPFGTAYSLNRGLEGFECQHGPRQCHANLVQDCALSAMWEATSLQKAEYVACEMARNASLDDLACAKDAVSDLAHLKNCISSVKGTLLQLSSEYLTQIAQLKFVPAVTINGVYDSEVQQSALQDLTGTLCSRLPPLPDCAAHYNRLALDNILADTVDFKTLY